jgi:hypothetical protein
MKSLLILILTAALCGGAFLSKPSEQSFRDMVYKKMETAQNDDLLGRILRGGKGKANAFLGSCKYQDRVLWATIERDGQKIYTGAFSTWFAHDLKSVPAK